MSLIDCPECGHKISEKALACPQCGYPMGGGFLWGFEYRSKTKVFGLPLIHIVPGYAVNPASGRLRVAKGIIAIGHIAIGLIAIGGVALGGLCFGGLAIGLLLAIGGMALGTVALGGMAIGLVAIGGAALGYYSLGAGAFGIHTLSVNNHDPEAIEFFKRFLGSWVEKFSK